MANLDRGTQQPVLVPVSKPLSLIPVGLKEAALDSPSFRATIVHITDQINAVESWLEGILKASTKLSQEVTALESAVQSYLLHTNIPNNLSEASMDHDYTFLALKRYNEGAREFWSYTVGGLKRTQHYMMEPIKNFLVAEVRPYKDTKRQLDAAQKAYDGALARYQGLGKNKEASSLREDAFQLHEARKNYLKASMDICVLAPQVRAGLDALLIKVFTDQWLEMRRIREESTTGFRKVGSEMERIRNWSNGMRQFEPVLRRELLLARREIERTAEEQARPSRELESYSASTVPYLGSNGLKSVDAGDGTMSSKQGWLFMKVVVGRPARTNWVRRWCFCKNSVFGWLVQSAKSGGVEESEKIGVLLCGVRPAFREERRFCFEVKTKDTTTVLQAETQSELLDWLSVFDVVKRKALEEPEDADMIANVSTPSGDAAFAVNPPTAPEFAASDSFGTLTGGPVVEEPGSGTLGADMPDANSLTSRASFDVTTVRRGEPERERTRDRIIQKLDLHKKSAADTQVSGATTQSSAAAPIGGGIASLIAASHSSLPVGPGRVPVMSPRDRSGTGPNVTSTLVPDTLVTLPSHTNLTKTAVMVGMDRGYDLGFVDNSGGMPSGLMANQWGTVNYGQLARIDRGEIRSQSILPLQPSTSDKVTPDTTDDHRSTSGSPEGSSKLPDSSAPLGHRKTLSAFDDLTKTQETRRRVAHAWSEFPPFYPQSLKAQDAQFRMLFPNIDPEERVVLIFRGSWNPSDARDVPGRVYVTTKGLYFYSLQFGLVLVSGISLDNITEISAAAGVRHDMLYVKMRLPDAFGNDTVIPIKTYLEPLRLLQRRLNYLVNNNSAEEPFGLEDVLSRLVAMERDLPQDESLVSDGGPLESPQMEHFTFPPLSSRREIGVKVDRTPYGGDSAAFVDNDVARFRLPAYPVVYVPPHFSNCAASRVYNVSAKALFHIMFGDKSALFQLLYRERGVQSVLQSPWARVADTQPDEGRFARTFTYTSSSASGSITDSQVIDVSNDHLCYAVTDLKIPWRLPHSSSFALVLKIVITHVAKSRSKLAIYTKTEWPVLPSFFTSPLLTLSWRMIERQAYEDMHIDALEVLALVTDQVDKLGPGTYTKKCLAIFGPVGTATESLSITAANTGTLGRSVRTAISRRTVLGLLAEDVGSTIVSAASTIFMCVLGVFRAITKVVSAQRLLVAVLTVSVALNALRGSSVVGDWYSERRTARFMRNLGVRPDIQMGRALWLRDFDSLVASSNATFHGLDVGSIAAQQCARGFTDAVLAPATSYSLPVPSKQGTKYPKAAGSKTAVRRLERMRRKLGSQRHDLLIGLRMLNRLEKEQVQAEYERWVVGEVGRCEDVSRLLRTPTTETKGRSDGGGGAFNQRLNDERKRALQQWLDEYCGSCRAERGRIGSGL